jgi:hypothetical protein
MRHALGMIIVEQTVWEVPAVLGLRFKKTMMGNLFVLQSRSPNALLIATKKTLGRNKNVIRVHVNQKLILTILVWVNSVLVNDELVVKVPYYLITNFARQYLVIS